ncbi:unnamed protein product [Trichobilharzia regenti]|nr:unnamed protein product [Trichobilharzia regenti]
MASVTESWDWKEFDDHVELFIDYANNNNNNKVFSNNFNHELDSLRILSTWSPVDTLSTKDSSGTLMLRTFLDIEYHCLELSKLFLKRWFFCFPSSFLINSHSYLERTERRAPFRCNEYVSKSLQGNSHFY